MKYNPIVYIYIAYINIAPGITDSNAKVPVSLVHLVNDSSAWFKTSNLLICESFCIFDSLK